MSQVPRKPSYIVVSLTVTCLAALAAIVVSVAGQVPQPAANSLKNARPDFVREGAHQTVRWHQLSPNTLAEARRKDLPILLVVGLPWSRFGRDTDRRVFAEGNVAAVLNRYFYCVRVDGLENPLWLRSYLPLSRASLGFMPSFQMWALTPSGQVFDLLAKVRGDQKLDPPEMIDLLAVVRKRYASLSIFVADDNQSTEIQAVQTQDLSSLGEPQISAGLDFSRFDEEVIGRIDPKFGGLVDQGFQMVAPMAWRYLLLGGQSRSVSSLDSSMSSGLFDPINGGVFAYGDFPYFGPLTMNKVSVVNAEMAYLFALAAVVTGSPRYRWMAERTFDFLLTEMSSPLGFYGGSFTSEDRRRRSPRYSYGAKALSEIFPGTFGIGLSEEGRFVRQALDMNPDRNPQAVARFSDKSFEDIARLEKAMAKMAAQRPVQPDSRVGQGYADVHGHVTARLIDTARVLGDAVRLEETLPFVNQLDIFLTPTGVRHGYTDGSAITYAGDLLAMADASLSDYLASGNIPSLLRAGQLMKWLDPFQTKDGILMGRADDPLSQPWGSNTVELIDNQQESCTARYVRLAMTLVRLVPQPDEREFPCSTHTLADRAVTMLSAHSANAQRIGYRAAGFFCSALFTSDDAHAFGVGPKAVELANDLARRVPTRLVAPAVGFVREDLQKRKPGIYVVRLGVVSGPFSVEEATAALPTVYRTDRSL